MVPIKHLYASNILTLNNPQGVDMPWNEPNQSI